MQLIVVEVLLQVLCVCVRERERENKYHGVSFVIPPSYLFWWKYLCKWLVGPHNYRLQPQSHYHATYSGESICESGLSVNNSHRRKAQSYLHATYLGRSICKSDLSVHDSHRLKHRATYSGGSTRDSGLLVTIATD